MSMNFNNYFRTVELTIPNVVIRSKSCYKPSYDTIIKYCSYVLHNSFYGNQCYNDCIVEWNYGVKITFEI